MNTLHGDLAKFIRMYTLQGDLAKYTVHGDLAKCIHFARI
jgi:hypothetical protein